MMTTFIYLLHVLKILEAIKICKLIFHPSSHNLVVSNIIEILVETALDKWRQLMSVMSLSGAKN